MTTDTNHAVAFLATVNRLLEARGLPGFAPGERDPEDAVLRHAATQEDAYPGLLLRIDQFGYGLKLATANTSRVLAHGSFATEPQDHEAKQIANLVAILIA